MFSNCEDSFLTRFMTPEPRKPRPLSRLLSTGSNILSIPTLSLSAKQHEVPRVRDNIYFCNVKKPYLAEPMHGDYQPLNVLKTSPAVSNEPAVLCTSHTTPLNSKGFHRPKPAVPATPTSTRSKKSLLTKFWSSNLSNAAVMGLELCGRPVDM